MRPVDRSALRGAKGDNGKAYEASDTLRSTQRAEVVDMLSEGQIGGLVNGLKSIYLDGVPVQNTDGSLNFAEFAYHLTLGGPTSEGDHAFSDVQTEVAVGVTVLAAVPVVRTISDTTADAVRVTLTVPQLMETTETGSRNGASFEFAIDVQSNGGGYVERWHDTISGKASSPYSRAVRLSLTDVGPAPWDVRVRRITADSESANLVNAFGWASYTLISGVKMQYRNSAVNRLMFDAKHFSSIPTRWYDMMGVSDWDIPVNYNPLARTVSGSWNGLWTQGWTNNPAWVLHNLIKNPRYGLGDYVVQLPDKWTLYALALWCDEMLPDGRGGTEPRYTVNVWLIEQQEALRLLQEICSIFRGVLMHGGDTLTVTWDAPGEPVASYTPANVVGGLFTYVDGSSAAKKTSCTCWYTDRTQAAKREAVTWDDAELVTKYGLRNFEINPMGVATPSQAMRMAKWALYTTHYEEQTISFRVGAEGPVRRVGEVFQVSDPAETGERLGGRISTATTTVVQLDAPVTLAGGETYTLWVTQPHATDPTRLVLQGRTVTTAAGSVSTLTVSPAFSAAPLAQTVWLLEGSDVAPTLWRYVSIVPVAGDDGGEEYDVVGVRHEPGKWALVEADQPLTLRPTRRLADGAPPVASITITEEVFFDAEGKAHINASVTWPMPAPGLRYVMTWRYEQGLWNPLPPTSSNTLDFVDVQPGLYDVQVQSLNGLGQLSVPTSTSAILVGDQSRPDDVAGLAFEIVPGGLRLSWLADTKPGYVKTRLSYGATFGAAVFFWEGNSTDFVVRPPADGTYKVWAVHMNRRDVPSLTPAWIDVPYVAAAAGIDGLNNATVVLYQRKATAPAVPSAAVVYTFASGGVTGLTEGWLAEIPAGTLPLWVIKAVASATTATDSIGTAEWQAPVVLAQDGIAGASAPNVSLVANPMIFTTPANSSTPTPSTSTISAITTNLPGATYAWTVDGAAQGTTGGALVLAAFASGTRKLVTVVATAGANSATDTISIYSLREGSDAFAAGLDNESQNVTCDAAGTPSPAGQLPLTAQAYSVLGAAFLTSGVTYGIQAGSNSGFSSPSISGTGAVSIAGITADSASVIFTATRGSVTIPMRFTATKTRSGAAGVAGASTRNAYALYSGNPTVAGTTITTSGPSSLPASNAWSPSSATAWTATTQTPGTSQALFMTVGTYDPVTGLTTWQVPFLANLKVGTLSAITANMGTLTAGSINTTGYLRAEGNTSLSLPDPLAGSAVTRTVAVAGNTSFTSEVGVVGMASAVPASGASAGVWGYHSGDSQFGVIGYNAHATGRGVGGFGNVGVRGLGLVGSNRVGVYGQSPDVGVVAESIQIGGNGTALRVLGRQTINNRLTSTYTAGAPLVLPVLSAKPGAIAGGVALHSSYGIIFSDGTNWYAPSTLLTLP